MKRIIDYVAFTFCIIVLLCYYDATQKQQNDVIIVKSIYRN